MEWLPFLRQFASRFLVQIVPTSGLACIAGWGLRSGSGRVSAACSKGTLVIVGIRVLSIAAFVNSLKLTGCFKSVVSLHFALVEILGGVLVVAIVIGC